MNIAFFISDHGFGHIMRNLAVIKELRDRGNNIVLVTGEKHMRLAEQYLGRGFKGLVMHTDAGLIVKPGSLVVDTDRTIETVKQYVAEFPNLVTSAKRIFSEECIDKVVVDIVPWALTASKEVGIPSYLMASFTWIEQYEKFLPKDILVIFDKSFRNAENVLMYELANEPTRKLYHEYIDVGFVARPFDEEKIKGIRSMYNNPIVFMSLGGSNSGLDFDIDVSELPYEFISTEGLRLIGDNVTFLPVNVENTQDYIKAADYSISKAGWASTAELMLAGNKTALLTRPDVPEDCMIIEELLKRDEIIAVSVDELKDMDHVMRRMKNKVWKKTHYLNGYKKVADIIIGN